MTVYQGLRTFLLANASIAAVVGTRAYALILPQKIALTGTDGALVITRVDEIGDAHLRGPNALARARMQIDAYGFTLDVAVALQSLCRQRIDGYRGVWTDGASPATTLRVMSIFSQQERDTYEDEIGGGFCRGSADYIVTYADSAEAVLI